VGFLYRREWMALAKSKTGLGKGLSAVLGDNTVNIEPNDFEFLPIAKIEPRKEQPRSVFEEEARRSWRPPSRSTG
jgi:hypothetical protein